MRSVFSSIHTGTNFIYKIIRFAMAREKESIIFLPLTLYVRVTFDYFFPPASYTFPNRKRRSPVSFAREVPIFCFFKPFAKTPRFHMLRDPIYFFVIGNKFGF